MPIWRAGSTRPPSRSVLPGGRALPLVLDIRDEWRVAEAVRETAEKIGAAEVAMVAAPSALAVAKGGKGQVVLLSGEPAIGITDSLAKR